MLVRLLCLLTLATAACVGDAEPLPGPPCDSRARPEYCKDTCPEATCPGQAQSRCEAECRACEPAVAYCPGA